MSMKHFCLGSRCASSLLVAAILCAPVVAQTESQLPPDVKKTMEAAKKNSIPIQSTMNADGTPAQGQASACIPAPSNQQGADSTKGPSSGSNNPADQPGRKGVGSVTSNVCVEAVLLPYDESRRVFGKEIADHYAAVELTVTNHSQTATMIVHSVYIDYSQWALSGYNFVAPAQAPISIFEAQTQPSQIASTEYRVVRGELLDAQPWTKRNVLIRALKAAGAIATAYGFSISEKGIVRGISAFTGQVVPAAETFWPDGTIEQLNRISDLAFKVNKTIPKNASDIVVAFFPIERFLTPGLKKLFRDSPAIFFAPFTLVLDPSAQAALMPTVKSLFGGDENQAKCFMRALPQIYMREYLQQTKEIPLKPLVSLESTTDSSSGQTTTQTSVSSPSGQTADGCPRVDDKTYETTVRLVMRFLSHASLNTIRVVVSGDLAINVNSIPATITAVEMEGGNNSPTVWGSAGDRKGVIRGSFLSNGQPQIAEKDDLGIQNLAAVQEGSDDTTLHFKMTLSKPIPSGKKLTFTVVKTDKETNSTVSSMPFPFPVTYSTNTPVLNQASLSGTILSLSGGTFADDVTVGLSSDPKATPINPTKPFRLQNPGQIEIDLSKVKDFPLTTPACWSVTVQQGGLSSDTKNFAIAPTPTITAAKRQGNQVDVTGTNFVDQDCAHLTFQLESTPTKGAAAKRAPVTGMTIKSPQEVTFDLPAGTTAANVIVLVGGKDIAKKPLQ